MKNLLLLFCLIFLLTACSKECDYNQANNKLLAIGKVQGRIVAKGGEAGQVVSGVITREAAPISELIAKGEYQAACLKAEELAKQHGLDLAKEQEDMISMEELEKDGGKGQGNCTVADAAIKQMEIHGLLQAEVNAGRLSSEVFRDFSKETIGYAEALATDPSKACEILERVRTKYRLTK